MTPLAQHMGLRPGLRECALQPLDLGRRLVKDVHHALHLALDLFGARLVRPDALFYPLDPLDVLPQLGLLRGEVALQPRDGRQGLGELPLQRAILPRKPRTQVPLRVKLRPLRPQVL
eukprot:CAMPEP_0196648924 /NCGR_PEP_ID=MMETSP1085-20130531/14467_1 /TAXON_ID=41879 ORGANISM="Pycnococcus sp, Strain CCMP1998" /NCGR_SAMPLE_ID=MMETSP1085 /ASSEMBLY_ACC=CAM_ASM_000807 /LENGTH=116 /DNA_ID=CAMNT_0041978757 /DNA_START=211 /DNA_END=558 /DNA_ORIENTATION=+